MSKHHKTWPEHVLTDKFKHWIIICFTSRQLLVQDFNMNLNQINCWGYSISNSKIPRWCCLLNDMQILPQLIFAKMHQFCKVCIVSSSHFKYPLTMLTRHNMFLITSLLPVVGRLIWVVPFCYSSGLGGKTFVIFSTAKRQKWLRNSYLFWFVYR